MAGTSGDYYTDALLPGGVEFQGEETQLSSGTTYEGNPSGLIEYRYEPEWWVVAAGQRQNEAATHAPAKGS